MDEFAGQKYPAGHAVALLDPDGQYDPGGHPE
jgi:hypothetical protein